MPRRVLQHGARQPARGRGFTLVELLVTITILGILGSAVLFASNAASESARRSNTRTRISSLHTLLSEFNDTFRTRRVPVNTSGLSPLQAAQRRLLTLRQLMKMEIPDRWSDVVGLAGSAAAPQMPRPGSLSEQLQDEWFQPGGPWVRRTALNRAYLRRYNELRNASQEDILRFQDAECLYLVITLATGDGEARGMFRESDIGDVDGDGAPEFLDAWSNPIRFIRWAPGFASETQFSIPPRPAYDSIDVTKLFADYAAKDPDPFDPFRIDRFGVDGPPRAFRLVPLIFSGGPDGDPDIMLFNSPTAVADQFLDPFTLYNDTNANVSGYLGWTALPENDDTEATDSSRDNIHNHVLSTRY